MKKISYSLFVFITLLTSCSKSTDPDPVHGITVTTLAGASAAGYVDETAEKARFNFPVGIVSDADGNLYVGSSNAIRKITTAGVVTTLAGSNTAGYMDETGTAARFNFLGGVAIGPSGNLYAADFSNHSIRKITPTGVVTTLAGAGSSGYVDATGTAAKFNCPTGVAVDANENVYVVDQYNNRIRKITASGEVTTLAGSTMGFADATGTAAQFNLPGGIAIDADGTIYVGDGNNNRVRKVTPLGVVTTLAGSGLAGFADGKGTAAQLSRPIGIFVDRQGNLYVADTNNNRIRKITPNGVVSTVAGNGTSGLNNASGNAATFNQPFGITKAKDNQLYVTDTYNNCIRKINIQ